MKGDTNADSSYSTLVCAAACSRSNGLCRKRVAQSGEAGYRVGVILTLTGGPARAGTRERDGAIAAAEQINSAGGIHGRKLDLVIEDDAADPNAAVIAFNKLANRGDLAAVIGATLGAATMAVSPLSKRAGIPHMAPNATYEVTRTGNDYLFRVFVPADVEVDATIALLKRKKFARIGILHSTDAYGKQGADLIRGAKDLNIVAVEAFALSATDVTPQLTKIRSARPDVILVWAGTPFAGLAVKNAGQLGITGPLISGTAASSQEGSLDAARGSSALANWLVASTIDPGNPLPRQAAAVKALKEKYGYEPDGFVAAGWDAVHLLAAALRSAGPNPTREAIQGALEQTRDAELLGGI